MYGVNELKMVEEQKVSLHKKKNLAENILLLEGCGRAGKFLLGNLLCGFEDVEHYQYHELLEFIPYLMKFGFIEHEMGKMILQNRIDSNIFNYSLGRTLNFRLDDKSCIHNDPRVHQYLQRTLETDKDSALERIQTGNTYFTFLVHELLSNIDVYFELYSKLKIIHIERNPLDLAYSWYVNGWGEKFASNPIVFHFFMQGKEGPIPWFANEWKEEYETLNNMDRAIKTITNFIKLDQEAYSRFTEEQKAKIHCLTYEKLITEPDSEFKKISVFLEKEISPHMKKIKAQEMLPAPHPRLMHEEKLKVIKENASPQSYMKLMKLVDEYVERGSLLK